MTGSSELGTIGMVGTVTPGGPISSILEEDRFKLQTTLGDVTSMPREEACSKGSEFTETGAGARVEGSGLSEGGEPLAGGKGSGTDAVSNTSDTERSDEGKEVKKIQTTATTQVS